MRLAIVAHNLKVGGGLVVGCNITSLLPEIAPAHEYLITVPRRCGYDRHVNRPNVTIVEVEPTLGLKRLHFELVDLPRAMRQFNPDWIWGLGNLPVRWSRSKQALLIHDSHLLYPQRHYQRETWPKKFQKQLIALNLRWSLDNVDVVFCQTEAARERFVKTFRFHGTSALCPVAVSQFALAPAPPQIPASLHGFGDRFKLLLLAKYYAHKNIERVVDAYERYREELANTLCILTIEASQHPYAAAVLRRIGTHDLRGVIVNVGQLSQQDLAKYYYAADALLLPSLLESFSSTYLEAMHFHRPILTSDLDFARTVCDDAALYFDPWRPEAIKEAIVQLRDSPALAGELVQRGRRRLREAFHSWPDVLRRALDTLAIPHNGGDPGRS